MPAQRLRPYQDAAIGQIVAAYRGGERNILLVLPTGGGKTSVFVRLAVGFATADRHVLILVHRRELAAQAANRLREWGTDFGLILAGERPKPWARVQIASVQTLVKRKIPRAGLVICDEAHLSTAATWSKILEQYPSARVLGVTATPWRMSGKPLVGAYDRCIVGATPRQLREQGYLCDYVGFSYLTPDLSAVETVAGEYNEEQSAEAMRQPAIVANVVSEWLAHASTLSTVVFAVTVEHSKQLRDEFVAAGVRAEHLDGSTPQREREAILARVDRGVTQVLCNVGVAVEGLDIPRLKCIVLARPTKSLARMIQMCGRGRRPWGGLVCRIHDHAFLIKLHGLPDADRDYTLSAKPAKPPSVKTCETCRAIYVTPKCPACGGENEPAPAVGRTLATVDDAEQFTFSSEIDSIAEEVSIEADAMKPAIEVRWTTPGREIEGHYVKTWEERTSYGAQRVYQLKGERRFYNFPGTAHLDQLMARVAAGELIRVRYLTQSPGERGRKVFNVQREAGA